MAVRMPEAEHRVLTRSSSDCRRGLRFQPGGARPTRLGALVASRHSALGGSVLTCPVDLLDRLGLLIGIER